MKSRKAYAASYANFQVRLKKAADAAKAEEQHPSDPAQ